MDKLRLLHKPIIDSDVVGGGLLLSLSMSADMFLEHEQDALQIDDEKRAGEYVAQRLKILRLAIDAAVKHFG